MERSNLPVRPNLQISHCGKWLHCYHKAVSGEPKMNAGKTEIRDQIKKFVIIFSEELLNIIKQTH